MMLNPKALALTCGVLWGGGALFAGFTHLVWPGYAGAYLDFLASIYPGYHVGGMGSVLIGTGYALVDGAGGGAALAWLYNAFAARQGVQR